MPVQRRQLLKTIEEVVLPPRPSRPWLGLLQREYGLTIGTYEAIRLESGVKLRVEQSSERVGRIRLEGLRELPWASTGSEGSRPCLVGLGREEISRVPEYLDEDSELRRPRPLLAL